GQIGYKISVALKPDTPAGPLKHDFFLKTNDPSCPLLPILVEATVQAPLSATPDTARIGTVMVGQTGTQKVIVKGSRAFRITAIEGQADGITAESPDVTGATHTITTKWQPTAAGELRRQLVVKTDLDKDTSITVPVEGNAVAP